MERSLVTAPWLTEWWPQIVATGARGGQSAAHIIDKIVKGHSVGFPVGYDAYLVLDRAEDDALVISIGVGRNVRSWCGDAEASLIAFGRAVGCHKLRIEGRKGWRRILPHWARVGDDLELMV